MTTLMPSKNTWVDPESGVEIEMITYRTILVDRLRDGLSAYKNDDGSMPDLLASFILCAATTTDVRLPEENVPEWARWLHETIKNPTWRKNIAQTYEDLIYAPSDMIVNWWQAYLGTRDTTYDAPPELQQDPPKKPMPDPETGVVNPEALNFTNSSTPSGGNPSTIMSLPTRSNPPTGRARKAK